MRTAWMLIGLALVSGAVHADKIYRWTGSDDKVYYGDNPPIGARDVRPFDRKVGTTSSSPGASASLSAAAGSADDEARRAADCARKQAQLSTYRNATLLMERDSLGREREYSEEERARLIEITEADLDAQCGDYEVAGEPAP